jgi:hypothetical protein
MTLTISTPIIEFHRHGVARLSQAMARKLAAAVAGYADKSDLTEATVEDLLNYFPMRYEDRSNLARIADLTDGVEASLDLYVRVAGAFQVGKNRGPKAPPLYIFEVTAGDQPLSALPSIGARMDELIADGFGSMDFGVLARESVAEAHS